MKINKEVGLCDIKIMCILLIPSLSSIMNNSRIRKSPGYSLWRNVIEYINSFMRVLNLLLIRVEIGF